MSVSAPSKDDSGGSLITVAAFSLPQTLVATDEHSFHNVGLANDELLSASSKSLVSKSNLSEFQLIHREQKVIRLAVNVVYEFKLPLFVPSWSLFKNTICGMSKMHSSDWLKVEFGNVKHLRVIGFGPCHCLFITSRVIYSAAS